jgi:protein-tyrosine-phosphatase
LLSPARHAQIQVLDPRGKDIADPIGGPTSAYQRSLEDIEHAVRLRLEEWA